MVLATLYLEKVREKAQREAVEKRERELRLSIADMRRRGMSSEEIIERLSEQISDGDANHRP